MYQRKTEKEEFKELDEYNDIFQGLGNLPGKYNIKVKKSSTSDRSMQKESIFFTKEYENRASKNGRERS